MSRRAGQPNAKYGSTLLFNARRCPECGHKVEMPCRACATRKLLVARRLTAKLARSTAR